jgi:queuosine precursor transporter
MHTTPFLVLACFFTAALLISNTIASKIAVFPFGLVESVATILFPVTYILGDVITEVYGYRKSRMVIFIAFGALVLMSLFYWLAQIMPAADFWTDQASFDVILGAAPRIAIASALAFLAGELLNAFVLSRMKVLTSGKWLWMRTIGSTILGQAVDTVLFTVIAFAFVLSWGDILSICISAYVLKVSFEILATPATYALIGYLKKKEKIDTFDTKMA